MAGSPEEKQDPGPNPGQDQQAQQAQQAPAAQQAPGQDQQAPAAQPDQQAQPAQPAPAAPAAPAAQPAPAASPAAEAEDPDAKQEVGVSVGSKNKRKSSSQDTDLIQSKIQKDKDEHERLGKKQHAGVNSADDLYNVVYQVANMVEMWKLERDIKAAQADLNELKDDKLSPEDREAITNKYKPKLSDELAPVLDEVPTAVQRKTGSAVLGALVSPVISLAKGATELVGSIPVLGDALADKVRKAKNPEPKPKSKDNENENENDSAPKLQ